VHPLLPCVVYVKAIEVHHVYAYASKQYQLKSIMLRGPNSKQRLTYDMPMLANIITYNHAQTHT